MKTRTILISYNVGTKIKFKSEKQRYTVTACDERFIIASKPFNAKKTFIYTIIDLNEGVRGADNWYCKYDYSDPEDAKLALPELQSGDMYSTRRSKMDLDFQTIECTIDFPPIKCLGELEVSTEWADRLAQTYTRQVEVGDE